MSVGLKSEIFAFSCFSLHFPEAFLDTPAFHGKPPLRILYKESPVSDERITQGVQASFSFMKESSAVISAILFHQLKWKPTSTFSPLMYASSLAIVSLLFEKKMMVFPPQLKLSQT